MLALGADRIIRVRKAGKAPADPVLINLTNERFSYDPWVKAVPSQSYEWWWAKGLEVIVVSNSKDYVGETIREIGLSTVGLFLWLFDLSVGCRVSVIPTNINKPRPEWEYEVDYCPFNDAWSDWEQYIERIVSETRQ